MGFEGFDRALSFDRLVKRRKADHRKTDGARNASAGDTGSASEGAKEADAASGRAIKVRRELLESISTFLLRHGLDVTPSNLALAHGAMSGSDPVLARTVSERQISGAPITQDWIDQISRKPSAEDEQRKKVERMMGTLENSIAAFAATTEDARCKTADYRGEFSEQLDRADQSSGKGIPVDMLTISRAMLDTLQRIEVSMKESQAETEALQERLAQARAEADSDHLTGLPNRRAFERELHSAYSKAVQEQTPLYLAIADVDHFKRVNDTFGHDTGDRLLRAIAQILKDNASSDCFVARHGGEEFVLLIHADTIEQAHDKLDSARRAVETRKFVARQQNRSIGQITFSAGLADVMATGNPRDALSSADDCLYAAKEAGRNRIITAAPPSSAN